MLGLVFKHQDFDIKSQKICKQKSGRVTTNKKKSTQNQKQPSCGRESRRQTTGRVRVFATANTERTKGRAERQGLGQSPNEIKVPTGTTKVITLYYSLSSACLSYQGELLTLYRQIGDNSQRI